MRPWLLAALLLLPSTARAVELPEHDCEKPGAARFEVAPWIALGTGVRAVDGTQRPLGTLALDVGVTVPVMKNLRLGGWASPGTSNFSSFDAAGGARVELQTNDFNDSHSSLFGVSGRYSFILDVGGGARLGQEDDRGAFWVVRLAAGFTAPNLLYSLYGKCPNPCNGTQDDHGEPAICRPSAGVVAGARPYVMLNRALDGARTDVTVGIAFEAIGAGWWLFSK